MADTMAPVSGTLAVSIIDSERWQDFESAGRILYMKTQEYLDILSQLGGGAHVFSLVSGSRWHFHT